MKRGRTEEEVTYTSINRELTLLRAMFNVLIKAGRAKKNPVSLVTFFEMVVKVSLCLCRIFVHHRVPEGTEKSFFI